MPKRRLLAALASGQLVSVLLALTGFISTNLTERDFVFPVLQSSGFYLLLCTYLISWPFPLRIPVLLYVLLALLDVEANFLAVKAYQFTDITSILLLNSLTIPWIVIMSFFLLKRRYNLKQIGAMFICLVGFGLVIGSDTLRGRWGDTGQNESAWIGDLICVGSSFLYACQNVLQEYLLKRLGCTEMFSNREYLGMLGLFGFLISSAQWLIFERDGLMSAGEALWSGEVIGLFLGFSATMGVLYLFLTWFIGNFDASLFNMSILTSGI
jgi:solute carrier family 35 protein F1/2